MYYVYILYSRKFDRFYIGQTDNLTARIDKHNAGKVRSTKAYIPWQLKYYEIFESRSRAMQREKFLKKQRNKDFYWRLINSQLAESRELGIPPEHNPLLINILAKGFLLFTDIY